MNLPKNRAKVMNPNPNKLFYAPQLNTHVKVTPVNNTNQTSRKVESIRKRKPRKMNPKKSQRNPAFSRVHGVIRMLCTNIFKPQGGRNKWRSRPTEPDLKNRKKKSGFSQSTRGNWNVVYQWANTHDMNHRVAAGKPWQHAPATAARRVEGGNSTPANTPRGPARLSEPATPTAGQNKGSTDESQILPPTLHPGREGRKTGGAEEEEKKKGNRRAGG